MKKINKIMLIGLMLFGVNAFADNIWFISPKIGESFTGAGTMTVQIQPPIQGEEVRLMIEQDETSKVLWRGKLNKANNYTVSVDISRFPLGQYSVDAVYYSQNREFEGDVDFWVD